jgi:magnesium transporter
MRTKLDISLNPLHLDDLENERHPSYFIQTAHYDMLILRLPIAQDGAVGAKNFGYIFVDKKIYEYYVEDNKANFMLHTHESLHKKLDELVDYSTTLLDGYLIQIDKLEDSLYERDMHSLLMDYWFDLKKDISRMERLFAKANETLKYFVKENEANMTYEFVKYQNVLEHLDRGARSCTLHLDKLDTLYNYYTSLKNDKINKNIYVLTILSAIFLPLNLVVGFFGMNTQGLFLSSSPIGTTIVAALLVGLFLFLIIGIPLMQKIELYVIRKILGKYDFYQNIAKHMKKFTPFE